MTGSDLFFLIQKLNDISEQMGRIRARDGFLYQNEYSISGYTVEQIRSTCDQACKIIDNVDFVPNRLHK